MGCDIHVYLEGQTSIDNKLKWVSLDYYWINRLGDFERIEIYDGRHYDLFGVLAGVRSDRYEPISLPKGIPYDTCEFIKKAFGEDKDWCHSFSYLTLKELMEHPTYEFDEEDKNMLKPFINKIVERAEETLSWYGDKPYKQAEDLRMVFWFDN